MAESKDPKDTKPAAPPVLEATSPASPQIPLQTEGAINARITELQSLITVTEQELKTLRGRLANRDPLLLKKAQAENTDLKARATKLRVAYFALLADQLKPKTAEAGKIQSEAVRIPAAEYCKKNNVDQEIWKNIAS